MCSDLIQLLRHHGINPSQQRVAVGEYVLFTADHPTADQVWARVKGRSGVRMLARATVYNTLNLFVEKGLLQQFALAGGRVVFDPNTTPHHHFLDEADGQIHDIPWDALDVRNLANLDGFEVRSYQVVIRGRRRAH
jgi:Fur family iron response transcriptional regulator